MKKLTAIFLLCAFLINVVGYHFYYYFELRASDQKMESALNNKQYAEADLITIRIPLSLPYQNDTEDFERITGEVSYKGKIYKYVKRKIEQGDFVLKCLPDHDKTQLVRERNDMVKSNLVQTQNKSEQPASGNILMKSVFSEFEQNIYTLKITDPFTFTTSYGTFHQPVVFSLKIAAPGQPPDYIS